MKRIPVTQASYKKISSPKAPKGVGGANVSVGKPDKQKSKQASYLGWGGFGSTFGRPSMIGASSTFYNNSYMAGGHTGGLGDVPPYIAILNDSNGGILYFPSTLKQKYQFYRYFYRSNAYVNAAVNLNTDLPMSRLQLRMPKMEDKKKRQRIQKFYENMIDQIKLFDKLHAMLFEQQIIGNAFVFVEYDQTKKRWGRLVILPPQEVNVANYPMSDIKRVQYRPQMLNSTILKYGIPFASYEEYKEYVEQLPEEDQSVLRSVSYEFVKQLRENNGLLTFDTDPYSGDGDDKIGSFVFHFANKRHEYQDLGISPLQSIFTALLQKTHYMYTQLSLASRNMTPRDVITAPNITKQALEQLRQQVDMSMLSPDYKIVANYDINWQTIGAENRLIDLQRQNEVIQNELFAGLGVSKELLTGQGMYSGNKISLEVLNTKYLLKRQNLQNFVENSLFKPVALQNGFYEDDEEGNRTWFYPKISFTRLTIRDNQEVFDALFQLYQKGSLPIGVILDIFNINSDDVDEELKKDMFTPRDATYNEMLRQIYSNLGDSVAQNTDLAKQISESITGPLGTKLKYTGEDADEEQGLTEEQEIDQNVESPDLEQEEVDLSEETEEQPTSETDEESEQKKNVENYLEKITKDTSSQQTNNVKNYLNEVLNESQEDKNAQKYLDKIMNFGKDDVDIFGQNPQDNSALVDEQAQSAKL